MKFSKKNYPILNELTNTNSLFKFQEKGLTEKLIKSGDSSDDIVKNIISLCQIHTSSDNIDFVSVPFLEKVMSDKIFSKLTPVFTKIKDCHGIFLYPKSKFSRIHAIGYSILENRDGEGTIAEIHLYSEYGRIVILYVLIKNNTTKWKAVISNALKEKDGSELLQDKLNSWFTNHVQMCLALLAFKQFADIEVKEIGGKEYPKKKKIGKTKYKNESKHTINVLDSRWFTESIRGVGFSVQGHFRMQPCGRNRQDVKMIYIQDFEKKGYTRKARKNNH